MQTSQSEIESHHQDNQNQIVDISKLAKRSNVDGIKLLILNELWSESAEMHIYSEVFNESKKLF